MNNFRKNKKQKRDGYTMIEILVVISIIGFILSVAMYLLTSARENARIARNMQFFDTIRAKLGSSIIGWWRLDNDFKDGYGGNDDGALSSGLAIPTPWPNGIFNNAYEFDGTRSLRFPAGAGSLKITTSSTITLTFWFKTAGDSDGGTFFAVGGAPSPTSGKCNAGVGFNSSGYILAGVNTDTYSCAVLVASSKTYNDNKWHFVAAVFKGGGANGIRIYVDGSPDGSTSSFKDYSTNNYVSIGTGTGDMWGSIGSNGIDKCWIDDVVLFNEDLTAREIQKYYAEGAPKHMLAVK